jgi:hypothetical protein
VHCPASGTPTHLAILRRNRQQLKSLETFGKILRAGDLRGQPREYQRRSSDHIPLGRVVVSGRAVRPPQLAKHCARSIQVPIRALRLPKHLPNGPRGMQFRRVSGVRDHPHPDPALFGGFFHIRPSLRCRRLKQTRSLHLATVAFRGKPRPIVYEGYSVSSTLTRSAWSDQCASRP